MLASTVPMSGARAERLRREMSALPSPLPEPFSFDWQVVQAGM
jgi:hypothetical protein